VFLLARVEKGKGRWWNFGGSQSDIIVIKQASHQPQTKFEAPGTTEKASGGLSFFIGQ